MPMGWVLIKRSVNIDYDDDHREIMEAQNELSMKCHFYRTNHLQQEVELDYHFPLGIFLWS